MGCAMKTILVIVILFYSTAISQNYIPSASSNNTIELSVANSANVDAGNVTVEVANAPEWLRFTSTKSQIPNLKSGEVSTARFSFSVDKSAPVGKEQKLQFVISSPSGEHWTKEIAIQVAAPEKFELYQNYPNPFNPTTVIGYQLPMNSEVALRVYDIIGKEVATLEKGVQEAGYHQHKWNAANVASGMYIYQLTMINEQGKKEFYRKKLLLLK